MMIQLKRLLTYSTDSGHRCRLFLNRSGFKNLEEEVCLCENSRTHRSNCEITITNVVK